MVETCWNPTKYGMCTPPINRELGCRNHPPKKSVPKSPIWSPNKMAKARRSPTASTWRSMIGPTSWDGCLSSHSDARNDGISQADYLEVFMGKVWGSMMLGFLTWKILWIMEVFMLVDSITTPGTIQKINVPSTADTFSINEPYVMDTFTITYQA